MYNIKKTHHHYEHSSIKYQSLAEPEGWTPALESLVAIGFLRTTETVLDLCMSDRISFPFRVTVFALKVHCVLKMESKSVNSYFGKQ